MGTRRPSGFSLVQLVGPVWRHCQLGQPGKQQSGQSGKVTLATLNHSICQSDKEPNLAKTLIIPKWIISGGDNRTHRVEIKRKLKQFLFSMAKPQRFHLYIFRCFGNLVFDVWKLHGSIRKLNISVWEWHVSVWEWPISVRHWHVSVRE